MYSFNEIIKATKYSVNGDEVKIAVLGNCSTQFLSMAVLGNCKIDNINADVYDAEYNQIDVQLLDLQSELYKYNPDIIILWISIEKIYEEYLRMDLSQRLNLATSYLGKIKNYWDLLSRNSSAKIIQPNFIEIDDKILGNYSSKEPSSFIYQTRKLNFLLNEELLKKPNIFLIDLLSIEVQLGYDSFYDPVLYYNSKVPISLNAYPIVSEQVVSVIKALRGNIKKCLIMDLDNTIWGGIIGDDGINKIEIGDYKRGHVFTNLQLWIKQLEQNGVILAVCSKNDEKIAKEPFISHKDMILRLDDIAVFVANWEDKVTNIKKIQKELNISMDSIVFIDDSPFERNYVRNSIPEIVIPELPNDPANYLGFLQKSNLFEVSVYKRNDINRTKLYQEQSKREEFENCSKSLDEFLRDLEMNCVAKSFCEEDYARIAQLSQRSNQFNLRTIRYTENDIKRIASDHNYITLSCSLEDKFGDYGLVSIMIIKKESECVGFIDTWLMSCRAFKRGLEEFTFNKMVDICLNLGIKILNLEYIPTSKNSIISGIFEYFGFTSKGNNNYYLCLDNYVKKANYIKEISDE